MKPWSIAIALLSVTALIAAAVALATVRWPITQPIAFNHLLHVEDAGAECTDCHLYAINGVRATIPNLEICADCHEEALSESEQEMRLVKYIQDDVRIPWRKIHSVPDHVYFSHRRHTAIAQIECETCHGAMGEQTEPMPRAAVPISMNRCMDCHEEAGVSNDCLLCHR